ncbi:MAG: phosphatase PAP2 family protein [Clostridiales bacterium]|nr:phosphatase PAP2 family protein [Clostridiales bacterium]
MLQYILGADGRILLFIQEFLRFQWLNPIIIFITSLANGGVLWIVLAVLFLCFKKYRKTGTAMAVALLIGYVITNLILKNLVMRVRPYDAIAALEPLVRASDWSFPSGHSTCSMAAGYVMYQKLPKYLGIPAIVLAVIICLSRLYVGVHYPTDVICGALVGLFAAMCSLKIVGNGK